MNEYYDTASARLAFEDFTPGLSFPLGPKTVSAEEIVSFAEQFDPQPMHLDAKAGTTSLLGGLAASGWHTCAMLMRMMYDSWLADSTSQGSPGITSNRWKRPVLEGDVLSGSSTVLTTRRLRSRPEIGLVEFRHVLNNQKGETVLETENPIMFRLREPGAGS